MTPTTVALGNFDGLHLGHQLVVEPILNRTVVPECLDSRNFAHQSRVDFSQGEGVASSQDIACGDREPSTAFPNCDADKPLVPIASDRPFSYQSEVVKPVYPTVVTFNPHPQEFFSGQSRKLLTPPQEKVKLLEAMGVKQLMLLPFDRELAALTPDEFVEEILVRQLQAQRISVGLDFRFGRNRAGTATDLQAIATRYGVEVTLVPLHTASGERISSSAIRQALESGNIQQANLLLGRPYSLVGQVVQGQQLGRTIGFPTANLQFPPEKFLPRFGVYAVRAFIGENPEAIASDRSFLNGVMNVGCRPTVEGQHPTVEVHLLDCDRDLYGKILTVNLEHFLRAEQKFPSLEALKAQIEADCIFAKRLLS